MQTIRHWLTLALLLIVGLSSVWLAWSSAGPDAPAAQRKVAPTASTALPPEAADPDAEILAPEVPIERQSLGTPLAEEPLPEPPAIPAGSVTMRLLRWPDRQPLSGVEVRIIETVHSVVSDVVVPPGGRVRLDDGLRDRPGLLLVRAEGYEGLRVAVDTKDGLDHEALMRPTTGWYGRVVDSNGKAIAGIPVTGWWIESPRPFVNHVSESVLGPAAAARVVQPADTLEIDDETGAIEETEAAPKEQVAPQDGDADGEDERPALDARLQFLAAHGLVEATAPTNDEGWYYVEELPGFVLGQMTLYADTELGSSDVLRSAIPATHPELAEMILHEPRPVHGKVTLPEGRPVPGARVLVQLADGWSRTWPPLVTDELGEFVFLGPLAELAIGVEKAGFVIDEPALWKPESADGMWDAMEVIAPAGSSASALFNGAYGGWRAPLPRARAYVRVDTWSSDVEILMRGLGGVTFEIRDADEDFQLEGVHVHVIRGGFDPGTEDHYSRADGRVDFGVTDREWQPMVVRFSFAGYYEQTFSLPPGPLESPRVVRLARIDPGEDGGSEQSPPNGLVLGVDGAPVAARIAVYGATRPDAPLLWGGTSDSGGTFRYELPTKFRGKVLYFYAVAEGDGPRRGAALGPIASLVYLNGEQVVLEAAPGPSVDVDVHHLEEGRAYRVDWELSPFPGARPLARGSIQVPAADARGVLVPVEAFAGWHIAVTVHGATLGAGPTFDLARTDRSKRPFTSTRHVWSQWEPVTERAERRVSFSGGRLFLTVSRLISLSGVVTDMPWIDDFDTVYVAALGESGTWFAPVGGNGWFDLRLLPPGRYRLIVYRRPSPLGGAGAVADRGVLHGETVVSSQWPRHDIAIEWREAD
ncbi:MAG: hypothetical protein GY711_00320 [bacterium]|nr:hypothetical protein [bacterium]